MSALASQINWETDLYYSNHHIYCMVLDPQEHMRSDGVKEHVSTVHKKPSSLRISVCYLRLKVCPYYSLFMMWIESSSMKLDSIQFNRVRTVRYIARSILTFSRD